MAIGEQMEQAVEAAARSRFEWEHGAGWEDLSPRQREAGSVEAEGMIRAALPYLRADRGQIDRMAQQLYAEEGYFPWSSEAESVKERYLSKARRLLAV